MPKNKDDDIVYGGTSAFLDDTKIEVKRYFVHHNNGGHYQYGTSRKSWESSGPGRLPDHIKKTPEAAFEFMKKRFISHKQAEIRTIEKKLAQLKRDVAILETRTFEACRIIERPEFEEDIDYYRLPGILPLGIIKP